MVLSTDKSQCIVPKCDVTQDTNEWGKCLAKLPDCQYAAPGTAAALSKAAKKSCNLDGAEPCPTGQCCGKAKVKDSDKVGHFCKAKDTLTFNEGGQDWTDFKCGATFLKLATAVAISAYSLI